MSAAAEKDGTIVLTALLRKALEPEQATELAHSLTSPGKLAFVPVATRDSDPERVLSLPQRGREETLDVVPALAGEEAFSSADLGRVFPTQDNLGYPALGFEIRKDRREAFGRFTEGLTRQRMAIVLDGVVITAPNIESALYGTSLISGGIHGFTEDELRDLLVALRSGELELDLELLEVRHQNDGN